MKRFRESSCCLSYLVVCMKSCFLLALGISSPLASGSLYDELPPPPPRLQRVSRYVLDDCVELCYAFAATRRGAGHDLCDHPERSVCVSNFEIHGEDYCSNIYWSRTEAGEVGLVYSRNQTELTVDEVRHPVSCSDAASIVGSDDFDR